MRTDEFIHEKQEELKKLQAAAEQKGHDLGEAFHTKRDEAMKKLEALRSETGERVDVLRMGFESVWAELKATLDTVTARDMNKKS
jgi:hypothetical protein